LGDWWSDRSEGSFENLVRILVDLPITIPNRRGAGSLGEREAG